MSNFKCKGVWKFWEHKSYREDERIRIIRSERMLEESKKYLFE